MFVYVIAGSGSTDCGSERIDWRYGDTLVLPGAVGEVLHATTSDAVLWIVTNEPELAFENLRSPKAGEAPTDVVHFPADEVRRQIELLYRVNRGADIEGSALIFLLRTPGKHPKFPADAHGADELAACRHVAAAASAQSVQANRIERFRWGKIGAVPRHHGQLLLSQPSIYGFGCCTRLS